MCHVTDRFFSAVRALTAEGMVKQRLVTAYVDHLEAIRADDVPDAIRTPFDSLRNAMTEVPPTEKETSVQVSVRKMSPTDASRYTRSIVMMFSELVRVHQSGERLLSSPSNRRAPPVKLAEKKVQVPRFLALG